MPSGHQQPIYTIENLDRAPHRIKIDLPVLQGYANSVAGLLNERILVEGRESGSRDQYRFKLAAGSHLVDETWRTYGTARERLVTILNLLNGVAYLKAKRQGREVADMTWR